MVIYNGNGADGVYWKNKRTTCKYNKSAHSQLKNTLFN